MTRGVMVSTIPSGLYRNTSVGDLSTLASAPGKEDAFGANPRPRLECRGACGGHEQGHSDRIGLGNVWGNKLLFGSPDGREVPDGSTSSTSQTRRQILDADRGDRRGVLAGLEGTRWGDQGAIAGGETMAKSDRDPLPIRMFGVDGSEVEVTTGNAGA